VGKGMRDQEKSLKDIVKDYSKNWVIDTPSVKDEARSYGYSDRDVEQFLEGLERSGVTKRDNEFNGGQFPFVFKVIPPFRI
jgi:hypothetical protein